MKLKPTRDEQDLADGILDLIFVIGFIGFALYSLINS